MATIVHALLLTAIATPGGPRLTDTSSAAAAAALERPAAPAAAVEVTPPPERPHGAYGLLGPPVGAVAGAGVAMVGFGGYYGLCKLLGASSCGGKRGLAVSAGAGAVAGIIGGGIVSLAWLASRPAAPPPPVDVVLVPAVDSEGEVALGVGIRVSRF